MTDSAPALLTVEEAAAALRDPIKVLADPQ
jgi:hypothetical protein